MADKQSSNKSALLTIGQAKKMLGVSEATLRHWTDEGKIKAFVTPGGHRRYYESELRSFMGTQRRVHGLDDLVAKMEVIPLYEIHIARSRFAETDWYRNLSDESKAKLRELGSSLHHLAIEYLTKKKKQDEILQSARDIGIRFGEYLAEMGISLTDTIEAFLMHRTPFFNAVNDLIKGNEALKGRAAEALPLLAQITDEVLLHLVRAYQEYQGRHAIKNPRRGNR
jgi:excisionase family DNA binding protein